MQGGWPEWDLGHQVRLQLMLMRQAVPPRTVSAGTVALSLAVVPHQLVCA